MLNMVSQKQAVKQIVQVLVHAQPPRADEVILKSGRKKKAAKKKTVRAKPPGGPKPPPKPPGGPKPPDGFLSQVFGPPRPPGPQPFIQVPQPYFMQKTLEQQIADVIKKTQPAVPTPSTPATPYQTPFPALSRPPSVPLAALQATPTGSFASTPASSRPPSVPLAGSMFSAFRPIAIPQSAPNAANQPSVDVNGDGKEEEIIRPQQPAVRLVSPPISLSPYGGPATASSSSSIFGETPDQEYTPEIAQAMREMGVKPILTEQETAGSIVEIIDDVVVPRAQVIEEEIVKKPKYSADKELIAMSSKLRDMMRVSSLKGIKKRK